MSELIKVTYPIDESGHSKSQLIGFLFFLGDVGRDEQDFIDWAMSESKSYGTNATFLDKIQGDVIKISFPVFYDDYADDKNCIFMKKKNFIQFLKDWEAFGKSGKSHMLIQEESGLITLEDL